MVQYTSCLALAGFLCLGLGQVHGQTTPGRTIAFSGHEWDVKGGNFLRGPGPSFFSNSHESVWVDGQGQLHLKIREIGTVWHSAQATLPVSLGYGTYRFQMVGNPELFDLNVVLGFFVYQDDLNEIDIEFSRFNNPSNEVGQFVTQPGATAGNKRRFSTGLTGPNPFSTHQFTWLPNSIVFQSYHGHTDTLASPNNLIDEWVYTGNDIPLASGNATPRINLWQFKNSPPSDGQEVEVIISDFQFVAVPEPSTAAMVVFVCALVLNTRTTRRLPVLRTTNTNHD